MTKSLPHLSSIRSRSAFTARPRGIRTDVANAPIAVVDPDRSARSARIHDGLLKPHFRLPDAAGRSFVDRTMDIGAYAFVLDLPSRLEADLLRGRNPTIQLDTDAAAMTQAAIGGGCVALLVRRAPNVMKRKFHGEQTVANPHAGVCPSAVAIRRLGTSRRTGRISA
jgi:hypothetical protein